MILIVMATYLSFSLITSLFMNWYNRRVMDRGTLECLARCNDTRRSSPTTGSIIQNHPTPAGNRRPRGRCPGLAARQPVQRHRQQHPHGRHPGRDLLCRDRRGALAAQCLLGTGMGEPQALCRWSLSDRPTLAAGAVVLMVMSLFGLSAGRWGSIMRNLAVGLGACWVCWPSFPIGMQAQTGDGARVALLVVGYVIGLKVPISTAGWCWLASEPAGRPSSCSRAASICPCSGIDWSFAPLVDPTSMAA